MGALVLWLWEMTHVREVVRSNPGAVHWMDMTFFHIDCKNCIVCLKSPIKNEKEAGIGPFYDRHAKLQNYFKLSKIFI